MERLYKLDETDVKEILANYFKVPVCNVNMNFHTTTKNYNVVEKEVVTMNVEMWEAGNWDDEGFLMK